MPLADTAVKLNPVGSIRPFWLPPTTPSTPHSSMRKSSEPSDEIVSTSSRASCLAASMAARMAGMGVARPVAVSLWTVRTALMAPAVSARRAASTAAGSMPRRQSARTTWGTSCSFSAISAQPSLK